MQTIATSPTSRRGVLIENLTAVSPLSHAALINDIEQAPDRLQHLSQLVNSGVLHEDITISTNVFSMYSPTIADLETPDILLRERRQKDTLLILYGEDREKSKIIQEITANQKYVEVRVVSTCEELSSVCEELSSMREEPSLIEALSSMCEEIFMCEDLDQTESVEHAQDRKLIVYDAKNCSDMVQLINAATEEDILVNFMGVGLTDLSPPVKPNLSPPVKANNKKKPVKKSTQPIPPTHASSTPGPSIFVRSEIETMIARVMKKAEEAKEAKAQNEDAEAKADSSKSSSRYARTYTRKYATCGMWVRLLDEELKPMMRHINLRNGELVLSMYTDGFIKDYRNRFHGKLETQRND